MAKDFKKNRILREREHFKRIFQEDHTSWWGNETRAGQIRQEIRGELAAEYLNLKEGKRVLEIGCATGEFTPRLARPGAEVIAVDLSPELIETARRRTRGNNLSFVVANAEDMPFKRGHFDAVVGNAILHHLNLGLVLPELKRVLRDGGKIFFTEPNMLNPQVYLQRNVRFIGRYLKDSPDETAFYRWQIKYPYREWFCQS